MNKASCLQTQFRMYILLFICVLFPMDHSFAGSIYKLGSQDIVNIAIFAGGEEQVNVVVTVSGQGMINAPFLGPVKAGGLSTSTLEKSIYKLLAADYFVNPQVNIQIKEYNSLQYSISGAVKSPGKYEMRSAATVMDLIAKAGGVVPERGNVAYILRESPTSESTQKYNEPINVNLVKLLDEGDMSHNQSLESGDAVYIPLAKGRNQSESKVYVVGMVKKPGLYDFQPGLTALSVCIMAGGFDKFAAPNRVTIIRTVDGAQKVIKIDLEKVIKGKLADVPLKPGDRLHIPESWM